MNYYLDAWKQSSLPVIPVMDPDVNLFTNYGVSMAVVGGSTLPYGTFKFLTIQGLLGAAQKLGMLTPTTHVIENTSGCSGRVLSEVLPWYGVPVGNLTLIMKDDVVGPKKWVPLCNGAAVIPPPRGVNGITHARECGAGGWLGDHWGVGKGDVINLDQYAAPYGQDLFRTWAAPQIFESYGVFNDLFCPIGTGGTLIGLADGLRNLVPGLHTVGVLCEDRHEIPGMRDMAGMAEIKQPWRAAADEIVKVERRAAFLCALWLHRATGIPVGPSGGAMLVAATKYLQALLDAGERDLISNKRILLVVHDGIDSYAAERYPDFRLEDLDPSTASTPRELIFGSI